MGHLFMSVANSSQLLRLDPEFSSSLSAVNEPGMVGDSEAEGAEEFICMTFSGRGRELLKLSM